MKKKFNCSKYNAIGHNFKTFTNDPTPKKARGKPTRARQSKNKCVTEACISSRAIPKVNFHYP